MRNVPAIPQRTEPTDLGCSLACGTALCTREIMQETVPWRHKGAREVKITGAITLQQHQRKTVLQPKPTLSPSPVRRLAWTLEF